MNKLGRVPEEPSADEQVVREVLASLVGPTAVADLDPEDSLIELAAWDSLVQVSFIAAIEERFGVQLTFDEILLMQSVSACAAALAGARTRAVD